MNALARWIIGVLATLLIISLISLNSAQQQEIYSQHVIAGLKKGTHSIHARYAMLLTDYPARRDFRNALPVPEKQTVLIGDSIADGLGSYFLSHEPSRAIINRGIGGSKTGQMLERFQQDVIKLKPRQVVIIGGASDVINREEIESTKENITSMVQLALANGVKPYVATILPHQHEKPPQIALLNSWIKSFCAKNYCRVLDFNSAVVATDGSGIDELFRDEHHLNDKGQGRLAKVLPSLLQ